MRTELGRTPEFAQQILVTIVARPKLGVSGHVTRLSRLWPASDELENRRVVAHVVAPPPRVALIFSENRLSGTARRRTAAHIAVYERQRDATCYWLRITEPIRGRQITSPEPGPASARVLERIPLRNLEMLMIGISTRH